MTECLRYCDDDSHDGHYQDWTGVEMSEKDAVKASPISQATRSFEYCVSGRLRSDVRQELLDAKAFQRKTDIALHAQRVELCRIAWNQKYGGEHRFDPNAAYTSLISGEALDQRLCDDLFRVTHAIVALEDELSQRS